MKSNTRGHSSLLISDYIINKHGGRFTPFHLIKLVFISHGRTLALLKRPLIRDRIEAWKYGPVIPMLYNELRIWGREIVPELHYCGTVPGRNTVTKSRNKFFESVLPEKNRSIIDGTVTEYGDWPFKDLQRLCHEPGSPWDRHYNGEPCVEIPDRTIQAYYEDELVPS